MTIDSTATRGIMTRSTRMCGAVAAVCLLAATACGSDGDAATAAPTTSVEDAGDVATTTEPAEDAVSTTQPAVDEVSEEAPASTEPTDVQVLDLQLQAVLAGPYRVETIGVPFLVDIPYGWFVQPNSYGHFGASQIRNPCGPGDRGEHR